MKTLRENLNVVRSRTIVHNYIQKPLEKLIPLSDAGAVMGFELEFLSRETPETLKILTEKVTGFRFQNPFNQRDGQTFKLEHDKSISNLRTPNFDGYELIGPPLGILTSTRHLADISTALGLTGSVLDDPSLGVHLNVSFRGIDMNTLDPLGLAFRLVNTGWEIEQLKKHGRWWDNGAGVPIPPSMASSMKYARPLRDSLLEALHGVGLDGNAQDRRTLATSALTKRNSVNLYGFALRRQQGVGKNHIECRIPTTKTTSQRFASVVATLRTFAEHIQSELVTPTTPDIVDRWLISLSQAPLVVALMKDASERGRL